MYTNLINKIIDNIKVSFNSKGHKYTGSFEGSLYGEVVNDNNKIIINIYGNEYGLYLNEGITPDRIPYTKRKKGEGKGGTSKYITGLHNWVKGKLGISDERLSLSLAFAIANKHSEQGMPVRNGQLGTHFIDEININEINNEVTDIINDLVKKKLNK